MKNSFVLFLLVVSMLFLSIISNAQTEHQISFIESSSANEGLNPPTSEPDYSHLTHLDWGQNQPQNIRKVTNEEQVLKMFLELKYLETILEKDRNGDFLPLTIISNNLFDKGIQLEFGHQEVKILEQEFNPTEPSIKITKYKIKKKKAHLEFNYKDEKVKIQLRKSSFNWEYSRLKASNNSGKKIDIKF